MKRRVLLGTLAIVALVSLGASPAEARIRFHYSSGHWDIHGRFGGYPPYWHLPGYSYYTGPVYRYYVPYRRVLPLTRIGRLPYIPPGTIYSVDSSAYRSRRYLPYYYYGYGTWPGASFAAAYLASAPVVSTSSHTTVQPAVPPVRNDVKVIVQVLPQENSGTNVSVRAGAWDNKLWRVPVDGATRRTDGARISQTGSEVPVRVAAAGRTEAPPPGPRRRPAPPADTQPAHLRSLKRGDDDARLKAAEALKRFNTPAVIEALVDTLKKDGAPAVRKAAAESLGAMLAYKARGALWQVAREDTDAGVRRASRDAALKIEAYYDVKR